MQPIDDLNRLPPTEFAAALKPLFEAAAPLAEALYGQRPFASYLELLERSESLARQLPQAQQIEIINAHPRIGENPETVRQTSSSSYAEQGYDLEAVLPSEDLERTYALLAELNRTYEDRFGFGFVVFVNRRPKSAIVEVLQERLNNSRDVELRAGLEAMFLIARDRYSRAE